MRRKLRILIIILAMILAIDASVCISTERVMAKYIAALDNTQTADDAKDLLDAWHSERQTLEIFISFDEAEEVSQGLTEVYVMLREGESASGATERLRRILLRIRDEQKLTWAHFL